MVELAPRKNAKRFVERATSSLRWPRPTPKTISARLKRTTSWRPIEMRRRIGGTRRYSKEVSVWKKKLIARPRSPVFILFSTKESDRTGRTNFFGFTKQDLTPATC